MERGGNSCPDQWEGATRTMQRMQEEGVVLEPKVFRRLTMNCARTGIHL